MLELRLGTRAVAPLEICPRAAEMSGVPGAARRQVAALRNRRANSKNTGEDHRRRHATEEHLHGLRATGVPRARRGRTGPDGPNGVTDAARTTSELPGKSARADEAVEEGSMS